MLWLNRRLIAAVTAGLCIAGCSRKPVHVEDIPPDPSPAATASPTSTPPVYIPSKRMETSKLFNGIQVRTTVETEFGTTATAERNTPDSYVLDLQLKINVPKPNESIEELSRLNENLPVVLPGLATLKKSVSPFYEQLYKLKIANTQHNIVRLDALLSKHNFYDCETILNLEHPETGRRAILVQSDMDVDMDGSDSDRVADVDGSSATFQPMTSYKWPKRTAVPNPFLASRQEKLAQLEKELAGKDLTPKRTQELRTVIPQVKYEVNELKKSSFLVSVADPFIVLPGSMLKKQYEPFMPRIGDYCVVIFNDQLYPAIVGDAGPTYKMGEASLRLCKELNARATAYSRPVTELKATYLVFPGTADKPASVPDLEKWRVKCEELLNEIGGYQGNLFAWKDITVPPPTPTPVPAISVTPLPSPGMSPSPAVSPAASVSPTPSPSASPASPSPSPSASVTPKPPGA